MYLVRLQIRGLLIKITSILKFASTFWEMALAAGFFFHDGHITFTVKNTIFNKHCSFKLSNHQKFLK